MFHEKTYDKLIERRIAPSEDPWSPPTTLGNKREFMLPFGARYVDEYIAGVVGDLSGCGRVAPCTSIHRSAQSTHRRQSIQCEMIDSRLRTVAD
ncbi:hypothetical protein EVAR_49659_1 [Eumeta japonica]|uniref:Uncharacterized protein n=1 Tax=Eumeta variegata TaxID=151549 RepID=A0A4C1YAY0_EUMVA|nr:hypothetical protein EVAR_49659_1 [Eumeta japonica]